MEDEGQVGQFLAQPMTLSQVIDSIEFTVPTR
jgi:hypothetical protein